MLVLTRKAGETIQIGDGITITVVDLGKGRVKIGIDAPAEVAIRRGELAEMLGPRELPETRRTETQHTESQRTVLPIVPRKDRGQARRSSSAIDSVPQGKASSSGDATDLSDSACCPWPGPTETHFLPWSSVSFP